MALLVTSRVENDIAILDLEGTLTLGPSLHRVRDSARDLLARNKLVGLIINLPAVTSADSAGLGELTVVYTLAGKSSTGVAISGASQLLRNMLEITRLDGLLPLTTDIAEAKELLRRRKQ
jgi:anti-anti-sigma factor